MSHVQYDRVADRYERGRSLPAGVMLVWHEVVAARLPTGPLRCVVDVGAGTGAFLAMWRDLGAEVVLAVEPSAAMRTRAAALGVESTQILAGAAANLPLRSASADV